MMERIIEIYLTAIWVIVPSFFWIRGIWRNDRIDLVVAIVINGVLIVTVGIAGDACTGINAAGLWLALAGLVTLVLGAFRKRMRRMTLIQMCLMMVLVGFLMMLVL